MNYFDQVYSKVFGKKQSAPLVSVDRILKRSDHYLQKYQQWKVSDDSEDFINDVWQSYFWIKKGIEKTPSVVIHESTYSNGFAINFHKSRNEKQYSYLFDFFADQVRKLGYVLSTSRVSMKENSENVETKEMYYLKPKRSFVEPIDQKFGNVQLEFLKLNEIPKHIKLIVNTYPDRKYKAPDSFDSLIEHLFNKI